MLFLLIEVFIFILAKAFPKRLTSKSLSLSQTFSIKQSVRLPDPKLTKCHIKRVNRLARLLPKERGLYTIRLEPAPLPWEKLNESSRSQRLLEGDKL